jgi:hypothetical protein
MSHSENPEHPEFEALIDSYLFGRLNAEETERFEKHYFDCPACFRRTAERAVFIDAVKAAGPAPSAEARRAQEKRGYRRFPPVWAAAGAAVLLAAVMTILFFPRRSEPPVFTDSGIRILRGTPLEIIEPAGVLKKAPAKFAWQPVDGAAEYVVIVEGIDPAWTAQTRDAAIKIPAEIAGRMVPGKMVVWRVKAFSAEGALLAASVEVAFSISR